MLASKLIAGFEYFLEHVRDGQVIGRQRLYNLVPTEGLNHLLSVTLAAGAQQTSWFVGLFEGNYTPVNTITAATIAAAATESSAYAEATRQAWTAGTIAGGAVNNSLAKAVFTINGVVPKTIFGGFLISSSVKGGATGVLLSVVRFATAVTVNPADVLRITAGITAVSA